MVRWEDFGNPQQDTGYPNFVLEYFWNKYCGPQSEIMNPQDMYRIFGFIHMGPRRRQAVRYLDCSKTYLHETVIPALHFLGSAVDEMQWNRRLLPWNHCPHFPKNVTFMVDTMPIVTYQPQNAQIRSCLYNGKYKDTVYKLELCIDFTGGLIAGSGPHIGNSYDAHLFLQNYHKHPLLRNEYGLGDGHYTMLPFMLTPTRQPPGGQMNELQYLRSEYVTFYRSRVEHINARVDSHGIFQSDFRCSLYVLQDVVNVTLAAIAYLSYNDFRYPPYGYWSHF